MGGAVPTRVASCPSSSPGHLVHLGGDGSWSLLRLPCEDSESEVLGYCSGLYGWCHDGGQLLVSFGTFNSAFRGDATHSVVASTHRLLTGRGLHPADRQNDSTSSSLRVGG